MAKQPNIYLIGPMGAGKSTIGRLLSEELEIPFIDSDRAIEEKAGANIPWIFDLEGEDGFRLREEQSIEELTQLSPLVLATGGGVIIRESNRRRLRTGGTVVYLSASVEQILIRTEKDRNRPLLQVADRAEALSKLMEIRSPLYEQTADIIIDTDCATPKGVVQEILTQLQGTE